MADEHLQQAAALLPDPSWKGRPESVRVHEAQVHAILHVAEKLDELIVLIGALAER